MDGRRSLGMVAVALIVCSGGCVTTQTPSAPVAEKNPPQPATAPTPANSNSPTTVVKIDDTPWPKHDRDPNHKHDPLPATEVAFGKMKEAEADAVQLKGDPETQARLRDDARRAYQQALKLDPNYVDAMRCLGRLYVKMKDTDRAIDIYKKALVKHAKESGLWYDMGLCYTRRKEFTESARCFAKALELEPENRDNLKMLGLTLAWIGQTEKGFGYLSSAQGSSLAHFNIARILYQKNQTELAKEHLRQALRENAKLEDARAMLTQLETPNAPAARRFMLDGPQ